MAVWLALKVVTWSVISQQFSSQKHQAHEVHLQHFLRTGAKLVETRGQGQGQGRGATAWQSDVECTWRLVKLVHSYQWFTVVEADLSWQSWRYHV